MRVRIQMFFKKCTLVTVQYARINAKNIVFPETVPNKPGSMNAPVQFILAIQPIVLQQIPAKKRHWECSRYHQGIFSRFSTLENGIETSNTA
jgi:hypothetical protein